MSKSKKHSGTAKKSASGKRPPGDVTVDACHHGGLIDVWFDSAHDGLSVGAHITPARALELAAELLKAVEVANREPSSTGAIKARAASLKAEPGSITIGPFDEGTTDESVEFSLGSRLFATTIIRLEEAENLALGLLKLTQEIRRMPRRWMRAEPLTEDATVPADASPLVTADAEAPMVPEVAATAPRTPPNGMNGAHRFDVTNGFGFGALPPAEVR